MLCYFPWNLRLRSAAGLLFPILLGDIIHPVSWPKSGISARLDLLDFSIYAFPFKRVILCLQLHLSFPFLFLHSFGRRNIPQNLWDYLKQIHAINSRDNYIPTADRLMKCFLFTYLSISSYRAQTNRFFLPYLYTSWQSPITLSALKAVNQTSHPDPAVKLFNPGENKSAIFIIYCCAAVIFFSYTKWWETAKLLPGW